jgi:hypothetical protein
MRCHWLPGHVVREANAVALAGRTQRGGTWRVRRSLMLGFFDEAFVVEPAAGTGEALVVDLRTQAAVPEREARTRAQLRKAAAASDPERERLCASLATYQYREATAVIPCRAGRRKEAPREAALLDSDSGRAVASAVSAPAAIFTTSSPIQRRRFRPDRHRRLWTNTLRGVRISQAGIRAPYLLARSVQRLALDEQDLVISQAYLRVQAY